MDPQYKISVIMPAYNEEKNIYANLIETEATFEKLGHDFEMILVDDGSTDKTFEEAQKAAGERKRIQVVPCAGNTGKGHALKVGFGYVTGEVVIFLDSDLDLHPSQVGTLLYIMQESEADVVIGSKRHPLSDIHYPRRRKMISKIYAVALGLLFRMPLRDTQVGLKVYKREVLDRVFPRILCKQFAFDVELLANAHHLGHKIVEAPIILNFRRPVRWGNIRYKDLWQTGLDTLAIFYRMHILKYYDRPLP
ncbi:MAG: glycosyltransferase family 2 protein [Candidatus Latescibacteria bacterium]|nr:glycosyltransferase family 2 protein [Candidatus Latescibacterota bacterium]MCK5526867.1 glycosyltransferase family 2 protein [Candidatus Latescibacterota bacterium]